MAGHYQNTVEDQVTGKPVNGATILVYVDGATISADGTSVTSGTLATIYSDDGSTVIDQTNSPLTTASNGEFDFYTDETRVVVAVLYNGTGKTVWNDTDILGGSIDSDLTALQVRMDAAEVITQDALIVDLAALSLSQGDILYYDGTDLTNLGAGTSGYFLKTQGAGANPAWAAAATTSQTGEGISGFIAAPDDKDYKLVVKAPHAGTITETTTISASGTCTATFKINTTALGGTVNSVSSSEQSQAHASSNAFAAGDDIVLTVSSNSSCADMSYTIKYTRTLA